jgi:hypothetical protein
MWQVENRTPFSAERAGARDREGAEVWLVGVKATFDIYDDGTLGLSAEQEPVYLAPEFYGDPTVTSLAHEADIVWAKPGTDVFVQGSAHSPRAPVTELLVALHVGPVRRLAMVVGNRFWETGALGGLRPSDPAPFSTMPLRWERAFGGTDRESDPPAWEPHNPVGRGFAARREQLKGSPLPNIEDPNTLIRSASDRPRPVGFGPIARHWHPRAMYAGTYDEVWMRERRPLLPEDFDLQYQHAAPVEQRVAGYLRGGEEVRLVNLHPRILHYGCVLPLVDLSFRTHFRGRDSVDHGGRLTSVTIDTDRLRLMMVWVSELACHQTIQRLRLTEIGLVSRMRLRPGRLEAQA